MERFTSQIDKYRGLSSDDAAERLIMYGYNGNSRMLETDGDFNGAKIIFSFRFLMMVLAATVLLFSGNIGKGFVMLLLAVFHSSVEFFKALRCRDFFSELKRISSVRFRVLRDGQIQLMRKEYIVPDDIIILQEGESVPADAHLLEASGVSADESLLTGDRTPTAKRAGADSKNEIKQTCIYKGTRILSGNIIARVTATGVDTKRCQELGEAKAQTKAAYMTGIETAATKTMPIFHAVSGAFFLIFFLLTVVTLPAEADFTQLALNSLLPAFAFALCLIPAECPRLVRSHYLYGAFSLLKKNCVVKDLGAMASLSAITAVCVDKTGAITKNHTTPVDEYTTDSENLSRIAVLSCDPNDSGVLDRAIILGAAFKGVDVKALQENELICRYPYSDDTKVGGNLWRIGGKLLLCIKGSPESVLARCDFTPDYLFSIQQKEQKFAEQGHRVVAAAYACIDESDGVKAPDDILSAEYTFVGLTAFANQTRDSAPAAVRGCYRAGVKVIMTTGDSADAAVTIGRKIGIIDAKAVTGDYLRDCQMNGEQPDIKDVNIFARVTPDQKPYIVELLQAEGEVVAVTGIGAADVEALEQANVGVALPQETSGAAKEACGLVLADDDFNSVVDALKETRQIHYNIKQTIGIAICAITAMSMFALFCLFSGSGVKSSMSPLGVSLPAVLLMPLLSLSFFGNRADIKGVMEASGFVGRRALDKSFLIRSITQGLCVSVVVLLFRLFIGNADFHSCFLAIFTGGLISAVGVNLSSQIPIYKLPGIKGGLPIIIMAAVFVLATLLVYLPGVNSAFGLTAINPLLYIGAFLLGIISQAWVEIPKIRDEKQ
jgi:Ca2+-transporting ATPase